MSGNGLVGIALKSIGVIDEAVEAALSASADPDTGDSVRERLEEAGISHREARALLISAGNAFETVLRRHRQIEKQEHMGSN